MNSVILIILSFVNLISYSLINNDKKEEYLQVRRTSYRTVNNQSVVQLSFSDNVWYQDSVGITQLSGLGVGQTSSRDSIFVIPLGYRLIDMRKKWIYEYNTFSDTAKIVNKFAKADSLTLNGGWGFYRRSAIKFDNLKFIRDTIINGINYQKYSYLQEFSGIKLPGEAFARCDRKGTIFHLDVGLSNAVGCPIVKGISYSGNGKFPTSSVEIEYVSNAFPDSVKLVFNAWKKNINKYPVQ